MTQTHNLIVLRAFGNDLDALINEEYMPLMISRLRGGMTMIQHITTDTDDVAFERGDEVRIVKPINLGAARVHGESSEATDLIAEKVNLKLDQHLYVEFKISDREVAKTKPGTLPSAIEDGIDKLAEAVNAAVFSCAKEVPAYSGTLDSGNERNKRDLINAKKILNDMKVNKNGRILILGSETESDLLSVFTNGSDQKAEVDGHIGRRFGFDIYSDIQCEDHEAGTASEDAGITTSIDLMKGSKVIVLEGATAGATVVKGDIITIGSQSFSVSEDAVFAGGSAAVSVFNAVTSDISAGTSAKVSGDHRGDLAFTKEAFLAAFRQLVPPMDAPGVTIGQMSDPLSGIPLRMLRWYNPSTESTHIKIEVLFGVKAICPERAIRLGGH